MQNSMVMLTFSVFDQNILWDKFDQKNQYGQFKLKFDTKTNLNI